MRPEKNFTLADRPMSFILLALIALLIAAISMKYRKVSAVIIAIALLIGTTTGILAWGLIISNAGEKLKFFYRSIGMKEFYLLIAVWYVFDLLCSAKIIMNYVNYKKVNKKWRIT